MKNIFRAAFLLATIACVSVSCGKDDDGGAEKTTPPAATFALTPIDKLDRGESPLNSHKDAVSRSSLMMNQRSYVELGQSSLGVTNPCYARIKRMANGNFILFYEENEHGGNIHYAISNNLKLWEYKGKLLAQRTNMTDPSDGSTYWRNFSCPDATILQNGDILVTAQYRPGGNYRVRGPLNGIVVLRSSNNGATWSAPIDIYQGVNWEPFLLQLSDGTIHCYFTDSSRTEIVAKDTGTALQVSRDNGNTWTPGFGNAPYLVIRSKYTDGRVREEYIPTYGATMTAYNDQMPVVIQLNESRELAAVMETARPVSGYDITFAYSGEDGEWDHLAADQRGPVEPYRNEKAFAGAAPYIVQFRSGETVVSYGNDSKLNMRMGNAKAREFGDAYTAFSGGGYWGSMLVADPHRLIGIMPFVSNGYVKLAQFFLNHDITATRRTATVDGSDAEWSVNDESLFVGAKSQAQATLRCSADANNVYFLVEVLDNAIDDSDYATIYLSPASSGSITKDQTCRIKVSYNGLVSSEFFNGGTSWTTADLGVTVKTKYQKVNTDKGGYRAEISIPRSKLNIQSGKILTNLALYDKVGGEDYIVSTSATSTAKWKQISGLQ